MTPSNLEKQQDVTKPAQAEQATDAPLGVDIASELEAVGLGEVAEVTEGIGENQGGGSAQASGKTAQQVEADRAKLIASKPPKKDMVREIRDALHKQLMGLEKDEAELKKQGLKTIMQYNDVIAKMRHINRLLAEVAQAGYKALKALWLRIVHGIV